MAAEFQSGDQVFYVLPKGNGRPEMLWLPAFVLNVTAKRIVIRLDGQSNHRNILATSLTRHRGDVPAGGER